MLRSTRRTPGHRGCLLGGSLLLLLAAVGGQAAWNRGLAAAPRAPLSILTRHPEARHDVTSRPLRDMPPRHTQAQSEHEHNHRRPPLGYGDAPDPVVQRSAHPLGAPNASAMPAPLISWDGINAAGSGCQCTPPDTNGEAGLDQYVQVVNTALQVWDKTGNSIYGPAAINTLWYGFGGACATENAGDPVVLYDQLADRWLISQFTRATAPYYECIAVSTTPDATGAWYRYAFQTSGVGNISTADFPDHPDLGVWPTAYFMSTNINTLSVPPHSDGPAAFAFNRAKMLKGQAADYWTTGALGSGTLPLLPADLDGLTPPPPGAPDYFLGLQDSSHLAMFAFTVSADFSQASWVAKPQVQVAGFSWLCSFGLDFSCIPQPGVSDAAWLDGGSWFPMYRLAYRNFGDHESLVFNHTVDADAGQAGVRWYEIRNPGSSSTPYQQGTYAPGSLNRWMGSVALDKLGNLALGYSVANASVYPSLRYAGRTAGDPLGTLPWSEGTLVAGTGSQTSTANRWGDYSDLTVDPVDDCTFWFTSEYYQTTSKAGWQTRIGAFRFPNCSGYYLRGDVINDTGKGTSVFNSTSFAVDGSWQFHTQAAGGIGLKGYCPNGPNCWGVYGKAPTVSSRGVYGQSTYGVGVYGFSNDLSSNSIGVYARSAGTVALRAHNPIAGGTAILANGNVVVNGTVHVTGSIAAPVLTQQGARLLYAAQSTQNIISDQGTATLKAGHAVVAIDPLYAAAVNLTRGYQVFVTPAAVGTAGLGVVHKTATSFEVGELNGGTGNFRFGWRIEALRRGYEQARLNPAPVLPAAPAPPTK